MAMLRGRELDRLICRPDAPLRQVIEAITRLGDPLAFQVVIDAEGRLLGTLTDGDIRRALLRGATMESPVAECVHDRPATARSDLSEAELRRTLRERELPFLPLLDAEGRVAAIFVAEGAPTEPRTALVMAGGRGARLGRATERTPKPLLEVGGRPLLAHVLDRLEEAGLTRVFVSVCYLGEQIEAFVRAHESAMKIEVLWETEPMGTAGALAGFGPLADPVLVVNGDVLTAVDYRAMSQFHGRHGYDATVAVARYPVDIPYGVVRYDEDGLFDGIEEKPSLTYFVSAGIYELAPQVCALVGRDEALDMPQLLNRARETGLRVGLFPIHEDWLDVGRPQDLAAARAARLTEGRK